MQQQTGKSSATNGHGATTEDPFKPHENHSTMWYREVQGPPPLPHYAENSQPLGQLIFINIFNK